MTKGPIGIPMTDEQAFQMEAMLTGIDIEIKRMVLPAAVQQIEDGERAEISWITTENVDREGDLLLSEGCDESHYKLNPIVAMNHNLMRPPVGKSEWRKTIANPITGKKGIIAKTIYPPKPNNWEGDWEPDRVLEMIRAGLLMGKSVGFIPLKSRYITEAMREEDKSLKGVRRIVEKWLLLEYSVCPIGVHQEAVVVSKQLSDKPAAPDVPIMPIAQIDMAVKRIIGNMDLTAIAQNQLNKRMGKV